MSEQPPFLIVDGHSMIFAWEDLAALHAQRTELARDELVKWLTQYQDSTGVRVAVVFDGRRQRRTSRSGGGREIQVFYSRDGQTADDVIERLVAKYASTLEMRVATNDRMEQLTVETFGALSLSAEMLRRELEVAEQDMSDQVRHHNRRK